MLVDIMVNLFRWFPPMRLVLPCLHIARQRHLDALTQHLAGHRATMLPTARNGSANICRRQDLAGTVAVVLAATVVVTVAVVITVAVIIAVAIVLAVAVAVVPSRLACRQALRRYLGVVPNRPSLRKLLDELLRSDSDLQAFCTDYFPAVAHRFTDGMDRVAKVTTLIVHGEPAQVLQALHRAFDELAQRVSFPRAAEHLDTLIDVARGQAKVVVTSRTEHFLSDRQVKGALARRADRIPHRQLLELCPFGEHEIREFLRRTLRNQQDAERWYALLKDVQDLLVLAENPRMLSFITQIEESKLVDARERTGAITAAHLYELLMEKWLGHEHWRAHPPGAPPTLDATGRWRAVITLAELLWGRHDKSLDMTELAPEVQRHLQALGPEEQDGSVTLHEVGSATLLVRDEQGRFSFLHRSVLEFAVAWWTAANEGAGRETPHLLREPMSPLMADFFTDLVGRARAIRWARRVLENEGNATATGNARLVLDRLRIALNQAIFRGQDLRGQDFSGRSLQGADFSDANLAGATLVGADLTGADLQRASFAGTDLSKAILQGADVRAADFSGATLLGADLRGATLAGVRFVDANLVGAKLDEGALEGLDTRGAALPRPQRVRAEFQEGLEYRAFSGWYEDEESVPVRLIDTCHSIAFSARTLFSGFNSCFALWDRRGSLNRIRRRSRNYHQIRKEFIAAALPNEGGFAFSEQNNVYLCSAESSHPDKAHLAGQLTWNDHIVAIAVSQAGHVAVGLVHQKLHDAAWSGNSRSRTASAAYRSDS